MQSRANVVDLHCDLLYYLLNDPKRTPKDPQARCSFPQLKEGGVSLQVLPIFSVDSSVEGEKQIALFQQLPKDIKTVIAVENASAICSDEDELQLERFTQIKPLYISLTWNFENRFGGGAKTNVGLKEDGKVLLEYLQGKNIAIDLSHTSDQLAYDILKYDVPIIASHSNCRKICNVPRNLPDELIQEIIKREGIIGVNIIRYFVGDRIEDFAKHVSHIIDLGGENHLALGCDFFYEKDLGKTQDEVYFPGFSDATCYPRLLELLEAHIIEGISHKNINMFCKKKNLLI